MLLGAAMTFVFLAAIQLGLTGLDISTVSASSSLGSCLQSFCVIAAPLAAAMVVLCFLGSWLDTMKRVPDVCGLPIARRDTHAILHTRASSHLRPPCSFS